MLSFFHFGIRTFLNFFFLNMCQSHETSNISEKFCNFKETLDVLERLDVKRDLDALKRQLLKYLI